MKVLVFYSSYNYGEICFLKTFIGTIFSVGGVKNQLGRKTEVSS